MMTLDECIRRTAVHSYNTVEELKSLLSSNPVYYGEEGLIVYNFEDGVKGRMMNLFVVAGDDGKGLWKMINKLAKENSCSGLYCVTQRPDALERKYGFKPVGTLMIREVV